MKFYNKDVEIHPTREGTEINIDIDESDVVEVANTGRLLDEIGLDAVLKHFDHREILDAIGE